ncbi:MAG TPA: hypothetical protein VF766_11795, partial [Pyrinomonadaceae bacterium]
SVVSRVMGRGSMRLPCRNLLLFFAIALFTLRVMFQARAAQAPLVARAQLRARILAQLYLLTPAG